MKKIAFFDTKAYDKIWFERYNSKYEIVYFDSKLDKYTAVLTKGFDVVCAFVNDNIDQETIDILYENGIGLIAMRCAGYSNVDFKAAYGKINVVRVPVYSPYAVAEHAIGLLMTLNRRIHKAYNRTREFNYSLNGLVGMDLFGKTVGVIGTGNIGRAFIRICKGFGMNVLAYDLYPSKDADYEYVELDTLFEKSDIISLHCPLSEQTRHLINKKSVEKMKEKVYIINTSRGALIETDALVKGLKSGKIGGAGLDVYEEEAMFFFEDHSEIGIIDDKLARLTSMPNVLITSHQAFLTNEALQKIAEVTLGNMDSFFQNENLENEVCYGCDGQIVTQGCSLKKNTRCF